MLLSITHKSKCKSLKVKFINFLLKGTTLMTTVEEMMQLQTEIIAALTEANTTLDEVGLIQEEQDLKLDEILDFILNLKAGQLITQEQLDALGAMATEAKTISETLHTKATEAHLKAQDLLGETDSLDD